MPELGCRHQSWGSAGSAQLQDTSFPSLHRHYLALADRNIIHQGGVQFPCSVGSSEGQQCPELIVLLNYGIPAKSNTDKNSPAQHLTLY